MGREIYNIINDMAEVLNASQIHRKLEKGYADIEKGNVEDAASAFAAFKEKH